MNIRISPRLFSLILGSLLVVTTLLSINSVSNTIALRPAAPTTGPMARIPAPTRPAPPTTAPSERAVPPTEAPAERTMPPTPAAPAQPTAVAEPNTALLVLP